MQKRKGAGGCKRTPVTLVFIIWFVLGTLGCTPGSGGVVGIIVTKQSFIKGKLLTQVFFLLPGVTLNFFFRKRASIDLNGKINVLIFFLFWKVISYILWKHILFDLEREWINYRGCGENYTGGHLTVYISAELRSGLVNIETQTPPWKFLFAGKG